MKRNMTTRKQIEQEFRRQQDKTVFKETKGTLSARQKLMEIEKLIKEG